MQVGLRAESPNREFLQHEAKAIVQRNIDGLYSIGGLWYFKSALPPPPSSQLMNLLHSSSISIAVPERNSVPIIIFFCDKMEELAQKRKQCLRNNFFCCRQWEGGTWETHWLDSNHLGLATPILSSSGMCKSACFLVLYDKIKIVHNSLQLCQDRSELPFWVKALIPCLSSLQPLLGSSGVEFSRTEGNQPLSIPEVSNCFSPQSSTTGDGSDVFYNCDLSIAQHTHPLLSVLSCCVFGDFACSCLNSLLQVVDIEEMVWSPKYGLKGMIDASVQVRLGHSNTIMPLELKTGKGTTGQVEQRILLSLAHFLLRFCRVVVCRLFLSISKLIREMGIVTGLWKSLGCTQAALEHRAQVILYTLLMSDRSCTILTTSISCSAVGVCAFLRIGSGSPSFLGIYTPIRSVCKERCRSNIWLSYFCCADTCKMLGQAYSFISTPIKHRSEWSHWCYCHFFVLVQNQSFLSVDWDQCPWLVLFSSSFRLLVFAD